MSKNVWSTNRPSELLEMPEEGWLKNPPVIKE